VSGSQERPSNHSTSYECRDRGRDLRDGSERPSPPQLDWASLDVTTEEEIGAQIAEDEAEALRHAAA
jgi:hypothetical protein